MAASQAAFQLWQAPWKRALDGAARRHAEALYTLCARPERHLTWFLAHRYAASHDEACTHTTRISSGTAMGHTTAARLHVPLTDRRLVQALVYACNARGAYMDRAYVVERFPGLLFKAHLEIDHREGADTVLDEASMRAFLALALMRYGCAACVTRSSRGGNRCHIFFNNRITQAASRALREECRALLDMACGNKDTRGHFAIDASTAETRSIRAPFARSAKPYRADWYEPWLFASPSGVIAHADEAGLTVGQWIDACSLAPVL
jgi:hypothetical protein